MAKIVLVLVFLLALVLSIQSVMGDGALSPEQINKATSGFKGTTQSLSSSAGNAAESVKDAASSLTDWAEEKLSGYGFLSPKESMAPEKAPAPAPAHPRPLGPLPPAVTID